MNTADYLLENADDKQVAIIAGSSQFTYYELKTAAGTLLKTLTLSGVKPGDRVGILGDNSLFWAAAYLAILKLNAIAVPFSTSLTTVDFRFNVTYVNCPVLCIEKRYQRKFANPEATGPSAGNPGEITLIPDDVIKGEEKTPWEEACHFKERFWPATSSEEELVADAVYMFTSGTTALPRVVRVTHRNIQANTSSIIAYLCLSREDRMMAILPFHYCFGTSLLHTHLRAGGSLILGNFTFPEVVLDLMEKHQATGFAGVPTTYQTLLRNSSLKKRELKSLRKIQQAGGKLSPILIQELVEALPQASVFVMYGQTEATARLSYLPPELLSTRLGSVGRGIPGVKLKVTGDSGEDVKPGEIGEIYASGENICAGYLDDPEASAEKFVNGELHTGDLATVDEDGFIYIVDRKGDFIKSLGYRVSSQQVEACILELPEVVSVAVIGEPDPALGEAIIAYVVIRADSGLSTEVILNHCRQKLARHMIPKEVIQIDSLPKNTNDKVIKSALREMRKYKR